MDEPSNVQTENGWRYAFGSGALSDVVGTFELEEAGIVLTVDGRAEIRLSDGRILSIRVGTRWMYDQRAGGYAMREAMARIGRPLPPRRSTLDLAEAATLRGDAHAAEKLVRSVISSVLIDQHSFGPFVFSDEEDLGEEDDPFA